jgi:hypothetical protein
MASPSSPESPELLFEATLFELKKQYVSQRNALEMAGYFVDKTEALLKDPTLEHPRVILGIDGKEYPFPTWESVKAYITKDKETKDLHIEQFKRGFTELQITPFAVPLSTHIDILKKALLLEYQRNGGHIYSGAGDIHRTTLEQLQSTPDQEFPLNPDDPLYHWDEYHNADIDGRAVYFPTELTTDNHGGQTKQQILNRQHQEGSPFPGYLVSFTHKHTHIPRQGETPSPHLLEANSTPEEYVQKLAQAQKDPKHPQYAQRGQTTEEAIIQIITTLLTTHQLIGDYRKYDSLNYTTSTWFPGSGRVGYVYAYRGGRQVYVGGFGARDRDADSGARSAVGAG